MNESFIIRAKLLASRTGHILNCPTSCCIPLVSSSSFPEETANCCMPAAKSPVASDT